MRRWVVCAVVAVAFALIGPRLFGPQNRTAGVPFAYEPPEGFAPAKGTEGGQAWIHEDNEEREGGPPRPTRKGQVSRVVLTHTNKEMSVDERDLAKLAEEMPKVFEECSWVHRRHEMRLLHSGARVGLIEGDCDQEIDLGSFGLPAQKVRSRKLQLMFPDDTGTSLVTISYPTDQAARWEPLFDATIGKARGVATRVPPPPPWAYLAWCAAGAVLAWLATALIARKAQAS